jgi:hypothetical protein
LRINRGSFESEIHFDSFEQGNQKGAVAMNELDIEATIEALRTLSARLETLHHMEKAELELPDQQQQYATVLEDAYATLARIETSVDEFGQELEYHHARLGKPIEQDESEA